MATKIDQKKEANAIGQEVSELEVLFPDREISIAGRTLVVRELRFSEQLKWQSLLNEVAENFDQVNADDENFFDHVLATLGAYADRLLDIVAICCDQSREWIDSLPANQGEELLFTWWAVNNHFFIRRLLRKNLSKVMRQVAVGQIKQSGEKSSPHSSDQDMAKKS